MSSDQKSERFKSPLSTETEENITGRAREALNPNNNNDNNNNNNSYSADRIILNSIQAVRNEA